MLSEIYSELERKYPILYKWDFTSGQKAKIVWVKGQLTIGKCDTKKITDTQFNEIKGFFEIYKEKDKEENISLITCDDYFYSNLIVFKNITPALQRDIQIPVRSLIKKLYALKDIKTYVACPFIIESLKY